MTRWLKLVPTVTISDELEALAIELTGKVKSKHIVERHVMTVTSEDDHKSIELDNTVSITGVGADAWHTQFALLAEGHVETKSVVLGASKSKVVLLSLELCHEIEAGVS